MIKVKKLYKDAVIPTRAHLSDAGLDLVYSGKLTVIQPNNRALLETGIAMAIPNGYTGLIWPRSGLAVKKGIDVLAGVIDATYRGEIKVALINLGQEAVVISTGDKIAQLLIQKVDITLLVEVDDLDETTRNAGGFGSTGS